MEEKKRIEGSYYGMYLLNHLQDIGDERQHDVEFIDQRADDAAAAFEQARRNGATVFAAQESAMKVLMEGFDQE